jgi:folate-dependent phosphoribosylglycinamide formyltransferase PurN
LLIKIGLLLDSTTVPVWQRHIIQFIRSNSFFTLSVVVLNSTPKSSSASFIYRFFRKIDRQAFKSKHDCFGRVDITDLLEGVHIVNVNPHQTKHTDSLLTEDIEKIKSAQPEVLIRFGFRILKGEILSAAKYGVWSLHHGDNAVNRGGPPAFWEVVNREAVTGVTLQRLSADLDGGTVIDKAFIRTDRTSFNRNQNALYWAGVELFCDALARLGKETLHPSSEREGQGLPAGQAGVRFYSKPLYRNPTNGKALLIFASFWWRRMRELIAGFFQRPQWSIYYKFNALGNPDTSLFRYKKLTPPPGTDWADPFVVKHGDQYYMFMEELLPGNKKAHISYLNFDAKGKLLSQKPQPVIKEAFHLSYPFILKHENVYYIVPESASDKNVWLYACEKFPDRWKRIKTILPNIELYDPTLHFHKGVWYLMGTQKPLVGNSPDQYLFIYYTDDFLNGVWKPHAQNPLTRDVCGARPAGKIFERNGKLVRPAQLGAPNYGYGIRFWEITNLSPTTFEEKYIEDILPHWRKGLRAVHTFSIVDGFSVVDVQE